MGRSVNFLYVGAYVELKDPKRRETEEASEFAGTYFLHPYEGLENNPEILIPDNGEGCLFNGYYDEFVYNHNEEKENKAIQEFKNDYECIFKELVEKLGEFEIKFGIVFYTDEV